MTKWESGSDYIFLEKIAIFRKWKYAKVANNEKVWLFSISFPAQYFSEGKQMTALLKKLFLCRFINESFSNSGIYMNKCGYYFLHNW